MVIKKNTKTTIIKGTLDHDDLEENKSTLVKMNTKNKEIMKNTKTEMNRRKTETMMNNKNIKAQ
jgi:hypothetical protein